MSYETVTIGTVPVANMNLHETVDELAHLASLPETSLVFTPNVDHLRMLQHNPALSAAYNQATLSVADGMPLVWASRLMGTPLPERVSGADVEPLLCDRLQQVGGHAIYLGGKTPSVTETAVSNRQGEYPKLRVSGLTPSMQFGSDAAETAKLLEQIEELHEPEQPTALFVCVGAPRSEIWAASNRQQLPPGVVMPVGAAIDLAAGAQQRASEGMREHGFEWLHRLGQEPVRLAGRYAKDAVYAGRLLAGATFKRITS